MSRTEFAGGAWKDFADKTLRFEEEDPDVDAVFHERAVPVSALAQGRHAHGRCLVASQALADHMNERGIDARVTSYGYDGSKGKESPHGVYVHAAVSVQHEGSAQIIDPTFRQFDRNTEFPLMESPEEYDSRMNQLGYRRVR